MPNTQILIPDISKGETIDTPKKFRNIDKEDFSFSWDNVTTVVKAGEVILLPLYKVNYAAMHLARKIYKRSIFEGKSEAERSVGILKFVNAEEEMKLQKEMVKDNFEEVKIINPIYIGSSDEQIVGQENKEKIQCDKCDFIAKTQFGLRVHLKKHSKMEDKQALDLLEN